MNAKYTTAEYVAAGVMHTMKVLTITLLAYAVTVIQPVESGQLPMGKCIVHLIRIFIYCYKHLVILVHCFRSLFSYSHCRFCTAQVCNCRK